MYINGVKVASNDNFNRPTGKEVKDYLKRGNNVIAVVASNAEAEGPAGFVAKLDLELDTRDIRIVTDASWHGDLSEVAGWKTDLKVPASFEPVEIAGSLGKGAWPQVVTDCSAALQLDAASIKVVRPERRRAEHTTAA